MTLEAIGQRIVDAIEACDEACVARSIVMEAIRRHDPDVAARAALAGADAVLAADPTIAADLDRIALARYLVSQATALVGLRPAAVLDLVIRPRN